jgi:hypothetical protein
MGALFVRSNLIIVKVSKLPSRRNYVEADEFEMTNFMRRDSIYDESHLSIDSSTPP